MIITAKWLEKRHACTEGLAWFKRNYPNGVRVTKKNLAESFEKLNRRKVKFSYLSGTIEDDTNSVMDWMLDWLVGRNLLSEYFYYRTENENTIVSKCVELWWKDYKNNGGK